MNLTLIRPDSSIVIHSAPFLLVLTLANAVSGDWNQLEAHRKVCTHAGLKNAISTASTDTPGDTGLQARAHTAEGSVAISPFPILPLALVVNK